jgi:hypothetical protein
MVGYQAQFKDIKAQYDAINIFDINGSITALDSAIADYSASKDPNESLKQSVISRFAPISEYYTKLSDVNQQLQTFIDKASTDIVNSTPAEERYDNRVYPEESSKSHEVMLGVFPNLKIQTIPYLLAAAVFMASVSIFIIFQLNGVTGQLNLPPALVSWWVTPSVGPPFYKNPMVLGGLIVILIVTVIVFAVLYYRRGA